jgi:hypothetical protein
LHAAVEASLHVLAMTNAGIKAVEKIKAPPLSLFVHFDLPVMKARTRSPSVWKLLFKYKIAVDRSRENLL